MKSGGSGRARSVIVTGRRNSRIRTYIPGIRTLPPIPDRILTRVMLIPILAMQCTSPPIRRPPRTVIPALIRTAIRIRT
jgi:hypothetical protein